ncbi:hypothetical protein TNIN_264941 [Trichonephila inaurata madagascariensis]|uniref:Uncharacterized protein n=1 Tax=Trichonephila inaurata madagascariensis TaxID=2747483 RepID=A0A8X7CE65_9ARAC|nr:hypothetical protein TNIN_264941 [Trichonephila inaurata madagascariensis]
MPSTRGARFQPLYDSPSSSPERFWSRVTMWEKESFIEMGCSIVKNSTKGEKNVLEGRMDLLAQCPDHPTKDKAIKKIDKRNVRVFSLGTSGQSLG